MAALLEHLDKFILVTLFAALAALIVCGHLSHDIEEWAREASGTVLGALMVLITGKALAKPNS